MDQILAVLLTILFVLTMIIAPIAWVCILVYGFKTIRNRKPEVSLWRGAPAWNPVNITLSPELLTEEGLKYRRRLFWSVAFFVVPILLTIGLAAITGNLK